MSASVDHVSVAVPDLPGGLAAFAALGFEMRVAGANAYADNAGESIELVVVDEPLGLRYIAIAGGDPPAQVHDPSIPLRFVARRSRSQRPGNHPNGVLRLERAYIVVPDLRPAMETYARVLGVPIPPVERGNVIKADMCIFNVGTVGIGVAQPVAPGPAADALARRGPGPFQLLFRTRSMAAAATWMIDHGLPPPARGTRNTGESAMLVGPTAAVELYLAFVGPE